MFPIQQQISDAAKSQFESQFKLISTFTSKALEGAEKIVALNLSTGKATLEKSSAAARELLAAKDPRDFLTLTTSQAQPVIEHVIAYSRQLFGIASGAQADLLASAKAGIASASPDIDAAAPGAPAALPAPAALATPAAPAAPAPAPSVAAPVEPSPPAATASAAVSAPAPVAAPAPKAKPAAKASVKPAAAPTVEAAPEADDKPALATTVVSKPAFVPEETAKPVAAVIPAQTEVDVEVDVPAAKPVAAAPAKAAAAPAAAAPAAAAPAAAAPIVVAAAKPAPASVKSAATPAKHGNRSAGKK